MLRNFNHDDFERFLNKNADQLRMQPTAKVWDNISKNIQKRKRRFGFVFSAFLIALSFAGYYIADNYTPFKPVANAPHSNSKSAALPLPATDIRIPVKTTSSNSNRLKRSLTATSLKSPGTTDIQPTVTFLQKAAEPLAGVNKTQPLELLIGDNSNLAVGNSTTLQEPLISLQPYKPAQKETATAYKSVAKKHKLSFEFFFTPTVSYRKLTENKSYINAVSRVNAPYNVAPLYNINDLVTHKPDMGLELAFLGKYPVSKNVKLRGGLQFNMSRYEIKALNNYNPQLTTIALSSRYPNNTVTAVSNYSNSNAFYADWLQNLYFQISVPVGLEATIAGNSKMQWGVASTLQPTRIIGDKAYLLSSDYKNYAQVPWLIRRWNLNTSFETFISYSSGHIQWQVGPQVRYQLLSSFINKYPVKENLFDFGLKVGVSLHK